MLESFAGNRELKEILYRLLTGGHIPHAILLKGEEGLGKRTVGRALSKAILCDTAEDETQKVRGAALFEAGSHPDFAVISKNGNGIIPVDTIRNLRRSVAYRPDRAAYRVFLIENADCMNREAQNAFLKILEEPPGYIVFILLANAEVGFLDTVLSRCTVLTLHAPTEDEALAVLKERLPDIPEQQLYTALLSADQNIGRALLYLGDGAMSEISLDADRLFGFIAGRRGYECLKTFAKYERDPAGLNALLQLLRSRAALQLRWLSVGKPQSGNTLSKADYLKMIELLDETERLLKQNVGQSLAVTRLCAGFF